MGEELENSGFFCGFYHIDTIKCNINCALLAGILGIVCAQPTILMGYHMQPVGGNGTTGAEPESIALTLCI
ncbi:hypothetical protein H8E07_15800 [bacterium]|nr:hypothetical protein [bacterium]